ncbi:MAG: hypothetical protein V1800_02705 [Candidatus Latescibacterota bacterium]
MAIQKDKEAPRADAQQASCLSDAQCRNILSSVAELKAHIARLDLAPEETSGLEAEVRTIEAQIDSPRPEATILDESFAAMRDILEAAEVKASKVISVIANIENLLGA